MVNDRKALVISLILPLLLTLIMGFSFGGGLFGSSEGISAIPVAMVGQEVPEVLRQRLADGLTESGYFTVTWADSSAADSLVREGKVAAAVVIPDDLLERLLNFNEINLEMWKDPGSQLKAGIVEQIITRGLARYQAGEAAFLTLWPMDDPEWAGQGAGTLSSDMFEGDFTQVWQRFRAAGGDSGWARAREQIVTGMDRQAALTEAFKQAGLELSVQDRSPAGGFQKQEKVNLFNYFLPSFSVFFLMFAVAGSCRDLHREQKTGTFQRQLLSPVRRTDFLLGKWLSAATQGVIMLGVLFLVGALLYRINLGPDPYSLVVTVLLCCTAASGLFLFLALVSPTEKVMDNLTTVVILISAMLGGNMIPLESMPPWMASFGQFGFNYWANLSFQNIMVADKGLAEDIQPVLVLGAFSVVLLTVDLVLFRIKSARGGMA
jgi:ABC-2 type transport system permease protein